MFVEGSWLPITRYDNAHQFVDRDDMRPDGAQIKTPPMIFASNEDAFNFALRDLRVHYSFYLDRYMQWKRK